MSFRDLPGKIRRKSWIPKMRLDKFLANMGVGTRTEVKHLLKRKGHS